MQDWLWQSATELGAGIGAGGIDPVALTETYLMAIESHAHAGRIYSVTMPDQALRAAHAARGRAVAGQRLSPLDGVPISWKDLFDTAGTATEAGSALLVGRVPAQNAQVVSNAAAMGLVPLGKTHMSELAFSGLGLNPMTATPPCVNDPEAVPGGSSSGAAASVAFGLAAAAIGSDTGGSVRIPSAWNDLVGLKTTAGRISTRGVVPLCPRFDTIGPMARSVADCAALLAVLEGRAHGADLQGASLKGRHLAVLDGFAMADLQDAPHNAFTSALDRLRAAGAQIHVIDPPVVAQAHALSPILFAAEAYGQWQAQIEADPDLMFAPIRDRFRGGAKFSAADYVSAWHELDRLRAIWGEETAGYDAVLVPTAPILPPNANRLMQDADYYTQANIMALRNTRIANLFGLSALTLPTGVPSCGITLMGRPMGEEALLRLGAAAEASLA